MLSYLHATRRAPQTRWYRAPELLCASDAYGPAIDLWSCGCILAEMLGRTALFPGRDVLSQLRLIVSVVGVPPAEALRTFITNEKAIDFVQQIARASPSPPPLETRFPDAPPAAIDLLRQLLQFDPAQRISAADALNHPFLLPLHQLNSAPEAPAFDFSFESATDSELKQLLDAELARFHPEMVGGGAQATEATPPLEISDAYGAEMGMPPPPPTAETLPSDADGGSRARGGALVRSVGSSSVAAARGGVSKRRR
jgi:serine/threonine protein kinase